ncbi:MAG: [FeFe] hydrogenase H-cluster radical SAM maturase HydE [Peptococcaceae bacterium]|nr:[FeFe] hydrogenase H-cluster radical SAM maturase HydE [Peptococcaceae bacterium]
MDRFSAALKVVLDGKKPGRQDIVTLLSARGSQAAALFRAAGRVRRAKVGDAVHLRAIIEFSSHCRNNCLYCGLRRDNRRLPRYRLDEGEIMSAVDKAAAMGFRTVVLQSGEDPLYSGPYIAGLVEKIKRRRGVAVTLSLGQRSREDYRIWREAGADRYLLKHETSDEELFRCLKPGSSLQARLECLHWLKELGYQAGSGNMVGLPGQSLDSLAGDILLMRELETDMAGIGPFLPHPDTPLKEAAAGSLELTLKTLAVARLCLPRAHLPATTALGTLAPGGRKAALTCGANVIMVNFTPPEVRDRYLIYPQKADITDEPRRALENVKALLAGLARPVARDYGHAIKFSGGDCT